MRVIVDECTGVVVARWLEGLGHDVLSIRDVSPRMQDVTILDRAARTDRIVITNDKDFGTLVYRDRLPHRGVILMRLPDARARTKIAALERALPQLSDDLSRCIVVVTETSVRVTRGDE